MAKWEVHFTGAFTGRRGVVVVEAGSKQEAHNAACVAERDAAMGKVTKVKKIA